MGVVCGGGGCFRERADKEGVDSRTQCGVCVVCCVCVCVCGGGGCLGKDADKEG